MTTNRTSFIDWKGVYTPIVTPFTADGAVDKASLKKLVDLLIGEGVDGLIAGGTTGEFYTQSQEEKIELYGLVKEYAAGRVKLLAGTSTIGTRETLELTEAAKKLQYDGCLVLPPAFCMPTAREIAQYFQMVGEVGLPIMAYNNPARTGVNLGAPIVAELAKVKSVVAFKETNKDIYAISETARLLKASSIALFAGLEPYGTALFTRGGVGLVSTISNVSGTDVVDYYKAMVANDRARIDETQDRIDRLYTLMAKSGQSNFSYVKGAMKILGRPGGSMRKPHLDADAAAVQVIEAGLKDIYPARAGAAS